MNVLILVCVLSVAGMSVAQPRSQWSRLARQDLVSTQEILGVLEDGLPAIKSAVDSTNGEPVGFVTAMSQGILSMLRSILTLTKGKVSSFEYDEQMRRIQMAESMLPTIIRQVTENTGNPQRTTSGSDLPRRASQPGLPRTTSHFDLPGYDRHSFPRRNPDRKY